MKSRKSLKNKNLLEEIRPLQDIEAIQKLMAEMKELVIQAGVTENAFKSIIMVGSEEKLKEVRLFLMSLYENEYRWYKDSPCQDNAKKLKKVWQARPKKVKV